MLKKISKPIVCFAIILLSGCHGDYTIKPKDYPKVEFPDRAYNIFSDKDCPLTFEYPAYSMIVRDSALLSSVADHPCWVNIRFPEFNATLYLSYKMLEDYSLDELRAQAHKMSYEHVIKADFIEPVFFATPYNSMGLIYHVGGDAASPTQFYVTDTISHFFRGALYFAEKPNYDSLAPVIRFINDDIEHLINTLKWE